jgi:hypothetical protein
MASREGARQAPRQPVLQELRLYRLYSAGRRCSGRLAAQAAQARPPAAHLKPRILTEQYIMLSGLSLDSAILRAAARQAEARSKVTPAGSGRKPRGSSGTSSNPKSASTGASKAGEQHKEGKSSNE